MTALLLAHSAGDPWAWQPHPDVWLLIAAVVGGYVVALRRLGPRLAPEGRPPVTAKQAVAFAAGVLMMWAASDWPVHDLAEDHLFSVHMAQHTVLSLVVPPLLLMGTPSWLLRWLVRSAWLQAGLRKLCRFLPATLLFNTVVVASHIPIVVDVTVANEAVHLAAHTVLFASAAVMWLPIVNRVPELPTFSLPMSMMYLFAQSIVPTVPASFLAFAERPLYSAYAELPRTFGMSAVADQQLAGATMKVGGGMLLWAVIVYLFFRWYAANERDQGDVLTWADVERQLQRSNPGPRERIPM